MMGKNHEQPWFPVDFPGKTTPVKPGPTSPTVQESGFNSVSHGWPIDKAHAAETGTPGASCRSFHVISWIQKCHYPLVMTNIAMENYHRNSGFSH